VTLRRVTRDAIETLDRAGPSDAPRIVQPVREALAERGLAPGCHVGRTGMTDEQIVEWYAGQLVDTVDKEAWYAINSVINTADKFCPKEMQP